MCSCNKNLIDGQQLIQESKQPSFNKNRSNHRSTRIKATIVQQESKQPSFNKKSLVSLPEQWNCESLSATVVYVNFGAWKSQRPRRRSIIVLVSPLEVLMLDVAEAFTAIDTSNANFISQHHSSGLPCY